MPGPDDERAVETLLRATLTDPRRRLPLEPARVEQLHGRIARRRRERRVAWTAAATVLGLGLTGLAVSRGVPLGRGAAAPGRSTSPAAGAPGTVSSGKVTSGVASAGPSLPGPTISTGPKAFGADSAPAAMTIQSGSLWFLGSGTPATLTRFDLATGRTAGTTTVAGRYPLAMAVDPAAGLVWVVADTGTQSAVITAYAIDTLRPARTVTMAAQVSDLVALDGRVWLAATDGLWWLTAASAPTRVPGPSSAYALAADPLRHRLFAAENGSWGVAAIDPSSGRVLASQPSSLGKVTMAVASDGSLWLAGYGYQAPHLIHLDPVSLHPLPAPPETLIGDQAGVYPGSDVVWVLSRSVSGWLCVDARTGKVLQPVSLPVDSEVVSMAGRAFTADGPDIQRLSLSGSCRG